MKDPLVLQNVTLGLAVLSILSSSACLWFIGRWRSAAQEFSALGEQMDKDLTEMSRDMDVASQRLADQGRRIAWLESRVRSGAAAAAPAPDEFPLSKQKPTITERKHRILALAQRGQDADSIAATLGIPNGEVELIINLSTVS